jgi:hypothetical protein
LILVALLLAPHGALAEEPPRHKLPAPPAAQVVTVSWQYEIEADPKTERFHFTCTLPRSIQDRQLVRRLNIVPAPTRRWMDAGTEYARFDFSKPARSTSLRITAEIELYRCDLATLRRRPTTQPARDLSPWLSGERMIESDHPEIRALADSLPPAKGVNAVRDIFDTVLSRVKKSDYVVEDQGALRALKNGEGDCSEHSDLFVALCRARGIPALVTEGYVITPVRDGDTPKHAWTEVFIDKLGWVPFDPFHTSWGSATFDELSPTRIIHSSRRSDPNLENYHHWAYRYWGKPIAVRDTFKVHSIKVIDAPAVKPPAGAR